MLLSAAPPRGLVSPKLLRVRSHAAGPLLATRQGQNPQGEKELGAWNPPASALAVPAEWFRLTSEALQPALAPKPNTCSHPQGCLSSELCLGLPCPSLPVPLARRGCSFQHVSTSLTFPPLELYSPDRDGCKGSSRLIQVSQPGSRGTKHESQGPASIWSLRHHCRYILVSYIESIKYSLTSGSLVTVNANLLYFPPS